MRSLPTLASDNSRGTRIQLWLLTAALEALLAQTHDVLIPAAISSAVLLVVNAMLLRYVVLFDARIRREGDVRLG